MGVPNPEALEARLRSLLEPFRVVVRWWRARTHNNVEEFVASITAMRLGEMEKISTTVAITREDMLLRTKEFWDEWPEMTAAKILADLMRAIRVPDAPTVDWRPTETIPEDYHA